jgi:hypothetical protein
VIWDTKGSVGESGLNEFGTSKPGNDKSAPAAALTYRLERSEQGCNARQSSLISVLRSVDPLGEVGVTGEDGLLDSSISRSSASTDGR